MTIYVGPKMANETTEKKEEASYPSYRATGFGAWDIKSNLQYPLVPQSKHFIRFFINIDEESKLITKNEVTVLGNVDQTDQTRLRQRPISENSADTLAGAAGALKGASIAANSKRVNQRLQGTSGFRGNAARFGTVLGGAVLGGAVAVGVSKIVKVDKKLKRLDSTVTLYTPAGLSQSQSTSWDNYSDITFDLLQAGSKEDVVSSLQNGGAAGAAGRDSSIQKAAGLAGTVARIAATQSDLVSSLTRTAVNPKKDLLFRDVQRRRFSFSFEFAPRNAKEARLVANIITRFKVFAAPEMIEGTLEYLYTFPAEFDIEYGFINEGVEEQNKYLNKISSCVLQDINVSYGGGASFQTLSDGEPVLTRMDLTFLEIETMHRDRILKGY